MIQTSRDITRRYYRYNFRLDLVLPNTWVLIHVRLGCHQTFSKQCLLASSNCNLTFYKTSWRLVGNWLPGYKSLRSAMSRLGFRTILLEKKMCFNLSIKILFVTPTISNWVCYTKMADRGIEVLIIQDSDLGLGTQEYFQFSVYSPNWGSPMPHFDRKLSESWLPSSLN